MLISQLSYSQRPQHLQAPKREQNQGPEHFSLEAMDSVHLSAANSVAFEPAAHLTRAADEYFALVRTHPSEADEFAQGIMEIKKVVGEVLYGGQWPDKDDIPKLPNHKTPGDPKQNGGLSRSEQLVSDDLVEIYRKTVSSVTHADQHKRLASSIHLCQSGLQARVLRRDYPNYWLSSAGSLEQDSRRESQRWGR